jgi:hypothetical protein
MNGCRFENQRAGLASSVDLRAKAHGKEARVMAYLIWNHPSFHVAFHVARICRGFWETLVNQGNLGAT